MKNQAIFTLIIGFILLFEPPVVQASGFVKASLSGRVVNEIESIWMQSVLIRREVHGKLTGICSGQIIANDTIVTAAHCVSPKREGQKLHVVFGYRFEDKDRAIERVADEMLAYREHTEMAEFASAIPVAGSIIEAHAPAVRS
jgi:hypothetical protein